MARATVYHGLPGQNPLNCEVPTSLADDVKSLYVQFEASNNTASGTVAEVSSIAMSTVSL